MEKIKVINDQFYTNEAVALECIKSVPDLNSYTAIIEPSAGTGSFSKQIKNCWAYDLDPRDESITKQDFLKLDFKSVWGNKILFIGNPPFGKRSILAKAFIKQSIKLHARTIAFVLPNIFKKAIHQTYKLFPEEWHLIKILDLNKNSFYLSDGTRKQDYGVPCSFFIWTKDEALSKKYKDLRVKPITEMPKEFIFLKRGDPKADFTINGNSGRVKELSAVTNSKAEHYIKVCDGFDVEKIKDQFRKLKYISNSSVNGGNYWLNQNDIIIAWRNYQK